ncbi:MAG: hypothetical protein Kow0090_10880 [Myxococcota bacterium]
MTADFTRGLSDLRWQSLSSAEKLLIASLLEEHLQSGKAERYLHLDIVIEQMRDQFNFTEKLPLMLTPNQNRSVAAAIENKAVEIENRAMQNDIDPSTRRVGLLFVAYLRSLVARLIRGKDADKAEEDTIVRMLVWERRLNTEKGAKGEGWVEEMKKRFEKLGGQGLAIEPLFMENIAEAEARPISLTAETPSTASIGESVDRMFADDELADMEIVSSSQEMADIIKAAFDAAMKSLADGENWPKFLSDLLGGKIKGLEKAPQYSAAIGVAANSAFSLARLVRNHIEEAKELPREAFMPGLKAVLDKYPGLKKRDSVKAFVKNELRSVPEETPQKKK